VTQTGWPTEDGIYELRSPTGVELWAFYRGKWMAIDPERVMSTDTLREMEYRAVRVTKPQRYLAAEAVDAFQPLIRVGQQCAKDIVEAIHEVRDELRVLEGRSR
jgi:molybdopterin/thiamine biosynthesis adenylyltransferase